MNRRTFFKRSAPALAAAIVIPKTLRDLRPEEHVASDETPTPSKNGEVFFIINAHTIVAAEVMNVRKDGRLDILAKDIPVNGITVRASRFLNVRRAKRTDFKDWGNVAGTWFVPFKV